VKVVVDCVLAMQDRKNFHLQTIFPLIECQKAG